MPAAQCPGGYLIGWVVDPANDTPIKFDGLIGRADLRNVTGRVFGNARYTQTGVAGTPAFLTLLTLDVMSNRPNNQVFVDRGFFGGNPSAIGNENQLSASTDFICWEEVTVDAINADLTTTRMGLEGVFTSAAAENAAGRSVTLLGIVKTMETECLTENEPEISNHLSSPPRKPDHSSQLPLDTDQHRAEKQSAFRQRWIRARLAADHRRDRVQTIFSAAVPDREQYRR